MLRISLTNYITDILAKLSYERTSPLVTANTDFIYVFGSSNLTLIEKYCAQSNYWITIPIVRFYANAGVCCFINST